MKEAEDMSEKINNREYRKQVIKTVIRELHEGKTVDEVKGRFAEAFAGVSATEISEVEQALVAEGLPVTEIQRLCDVHAAVFAGSIAEIHAEDQLNIPGHPAQVLKLENRHIEGLVSALEPHVDKLPAREAKLALEQALADLATIDLHYVRKENLFFPYLERYGIVAPPQVMWGVHDEIRAQIKEARALLTKEEGQFPHLRQKLKALMEKVLGMVSKEEDILLPMLLEHLAPDEWYSIALESGELGYLIGDVPSWAQGETPPQLEPVEPQSGSINLPSGALTIDELIAVLNTLPFDITFVDKNDVVRYFSEGKERIFPRARAVIGREVANCHPPASVHVVEKIVADFKSGAKDDEDFWIKLGDQFVLIRYFAVRGDKGEYMGVLEVSQNIGPIQDITGEKRLLDS